MASQAFSDGGADLSLSLLQDSPQEQIQTGDSASLSDLLNQAQAPSGPAKTGIPGVDLITSWSNEIKQNQAAEAKHQLYTQAVNLYHAGKPEEAMKILTAADPVTWMKQMGQERVQELKNKGALDVQIEKNKHDSGANSREQRLKDQFSQQMGYKYQQAAEQHPLYKSATGVLNEMPTLKGLLDDAYKNGGQSLAMLGPRIARGLAGEVGVLTEGDVTRYVRNPALARWLVSGAEAKYEGKLTSQDYSNLMRLGTVMEDNANKKIQKAYELSAQKMARNMGIDVEDARILVNPTIDEQTKQVIEDGIFSKPKKDELAPAGGETQKTANAKTESSSAVLSLAKKLKENPTSITADEKRVIDMAKAARDAGPKGKDDVTYKQAVDFLKQIGAE